MSESKTEHVMSNNNVTEEKENPTKKIAATETDDPCWCKCPPNWITRAVETTTPSIHDTKFSEKRLAAQEAKLRKEFADTLEKETAYLKQKFDYILHNEQLRTSHMLQQAQREKEEKISALRQQMECKNLAGLMYVMCAERTRCKFQKLQIIEKYTNYINMLNDILAEGQALILHLSRGYKSASRVNYEWQTKMKKIMAEFQGFVFHFAGGTQEQIQYFFDMPKLLKSEAFKEIDPDEEPIQEEEEIEEEGSVLEQEEMKKNTWWSNLEGDQRPFVVYGDMTDFKPERRREVLKHVRAPKTAPRRWNEYAFHDMFMKADCPNAEVIMNEYFDRIPDVGKWECHGNTSSEKNVTVKSPPHRPSRRVTTQSVDIRGNMGSILKIITASGLNQPVTKANLLGARDSMEICSSTRVRSNQINQIKSLDDSEKPEFYVGQRKNSLFNEIEIMSVTDEVLASPPDPDLNQQVSNTGKKDEKEEDILNAAALKLTKVHDSLEVITNHVPDKDHKVVGIKKCPMEKCHRTRLQEFYKKLPKYMQQTPLSEYMEQNYDNYETCKPDQLEMLRQRLEQAKRKEKEGEKTEIDPNPLQEWDQSSTMDVGIQTNTESDLNLPPCTCLDSEISEEVGVYKVEDLIPVKLQIDRIKQECLFDEKIEMNRFKVVGQESEDSVSRIKQQSNNDPYAKNFTSSRLRDIRNILKQHPSLCEIFQANAKCG